MSAIKPTYKNPDSFFNRSFSSILSLGKIMLRSKPGLKLPEPTGRDLIVLGNGPSLKDSFAKHPDFFTQHELICVNSFSVTAEYQKYKPKYYIMLDPGIWLGEHDSGKKTFDALSTKTSWLLFLFIPRTARKARQFRELTEKNKNISIVFFNYSVYKGFQSPGHFLFSRNLAMPQSQNVLVAAIFLGINMNYRKIFIFGADHSWHEHLHVNDDNILCLKHIHFYENEENVSFVPFYKGVHLKETFSVAEIFATWAKVFNGYSALNEYAKSRECRIYNASELSFIDAFERIKI